jgi:hypothetical protein
MPGMVLGDVGSWCQLYLAIKPSHVEGRCGWASQPSAPSYGLRLLDGGTELPVRRCLVPSCDSRWWRLSEEYEALGLIYSTKH